MPADIHIVKVGHRLVQVSEKGYPLFGAQSNTHSLRREIKSNV